MHEVVFGGTCSIHIWDYKSVREFWLRNMKGPRRARWRGCGKPGTLIFKSGIWERVLDRSASLWYHVASVCELSVV